METGPPTRTQPQSTVNDGWRKVKLTVPNGKNTNDGDLGETPVAPPRRKRSSVVDRQPCGFKELFGNNISRRSSCDSILKDDNPLSEREQEMLQQKRKSKSISDFNLNEIKQTDSLSISTIRIPVTRTMSLMERAMVQQSTIPVPRPTLQRKVSRVGNKKSDKFFGENLSDCLSDDPITPEPESTSISFTYHTISTLITPISHTTDDGKVKLNDFVDKNVTTVNDDNKLKNEIDAGEIVVAIPKPFVISEQIEAKPIAVDDKKSSLDKKAEFLMAMLEGNNSYKPVEETRMVMTPPRRSHLKKRNSQSSGLNESLNNSENSTPVHSNHENGMGEKKSISLNSNHQVEQKLERNNNDDDEHYKGMYPVEEPFIVPRKRPTRHICDDDHHHIRKHTEQQIHTSPKVNKENEPLKPMKDEDIEKYIIQQVNSSPEKPKRDFSVYEKSNQTILTTSNSTPTTPIIPGESEQKPIKQIARVRHLSQENLMSKKILTSKSNDTIDLMRIKSIQNANNNTYKMNNDEHMETILKKYTSQQSFFTQELLSQIADRVYGFQDPFDTLGSCDDGSSKCTPNSKLTTRKISAHRKESTVTRPIQENELEDCSIFAAAPKIVQMEQKSINLSSNGKSIQIHFDENQSVESKENEKNDHQPIHNDETLISDTEDFLSVECINSMVCDKIKTNAKDSEGIVTTQPFFLSDVQIESVAAQTEDANKSNHVLDDIYLNNNTILDEFQKNFNGNIPTEQIKTCDKSENLNSDDENTDSDITVKEVNVVESAEQNIDNKALTKLNGGVKRGSIVEVDAWFLKHNELSNLPRRGSESYTGYDTRKVFPFGKSDPGAGTEFFESKILSKSAENILNDNLTKIEFTTDQNGNSNEILSTDHSILLKYLK